MDIAKTWLLAILVIALFANSKQNEAREFKKKVFEKCRKESNLEQEKLEGVFNFRTIKGVEDHKCFLKCMFENYQVLNKDGSLDKIKIIEAAKDQYQKPEEKAKFAAIAKDCLAKEKKVADVCEYLFNFAKCCIEKAAKANLSY